jgi:signal transduction histidine kinase
MFSDVYVTECNDAKARMHGYSYASELVGKKLGDLLLKSAPMNIAAVRQFIKNGYSLHRAETVESGRFGRVRYFTNSLTGSIELDCFVRAWGVQTDITEQKEAELQIETSRRQLRALASHLQAVREQERAEISREIHDELGQSLTALKINISWVNKKLNDTTDSHNREEMRERVKDSLKLLGDTINNVKNIASQLHPRLLDTFGIAAAIEWQCAEFERRTGITCKAELPDDDIEVSQAISTAAFRILQEAMTNAARHSEATLITVQLKIDEHKLRLSIKDNGRGVTKAELLAINSLGLLGMRERAFNLGGNVEINGDPEAGTIVDVCIPLEPKAPQEKEAVQ